MRTYGRVPVIDPVTNQQAIDAETGLPATRWVVVSTSATGFNDLVYLTTLVQNFKLILGESPFFANSGLPSKISIVQQVAPDFYVMRTQQQFVPYFANLTVARAPAPVGYSRDTPTYQIAVTTQDGVKLSTTVPIAT